MVVEVEVAAQEAAEVQPVHSRELDIQNDERKKHLSEKLAGLLRGLASTDVVPAPADHPFEEKSCRTVVLDHQHFQGVSRQVEWIRQLETFQRCG